MLKAITIALFINNLLLNIAIANTFCVVLTCGHFSKTAAVEEDMAMVPPLGMATARTSMATAGGSGDDNNNCNKQERAR